MSLVSKCWEKRLDKTALITLMALCDSADDDGTHCYPSPERVCWKAGISRATFYRLLERFSAAGFIEEMGVHGSATQYTIHLEAVPAKAPIERRKRGRPRKKENPSQGAKTEINVSHGEKMLSHHEKMLSHHEKMLSHGEKKAPPVRKLQTPDNSGSVAGEQCAYPVLTQSLPSPYPSVPRVFAAGEPGVTPAGFSLDPQSKTDRDRWASSQQGLHYLLNKAKDWDRLDEGPRWHWYRQWLDESKEYALVE